ncbi:stage V sporulation protein G [Peptoclostridium litorale DSM 5388]|uniref:Putative septation protein SpoVG n=1 Tax=Peptoclostridium litorale DSM 5388 TaxID=1121324 RepID=A0A069RB40_PEPLI|nr:septation regulator SpoVG [Peptoclostridium litorale]KDR94246.1 putative septation protein SpoVG [Peptoclostridium litorale DSM 5388]SIO28082.1 stage V sporulation protein G [Peptoclostridium litorale DSM 5388]
MNITDIRVRKVIEDGKMKGVVSVTFDDAFVVHDIKIIEGKSGFFVAMPSKKLAEGGFKDIAHPINVEMRTELQDAILRAYDEAKSIQDAPETVEV